MTLQTPFITMSDEHKYGAQNEFHAEDNGTNQNDEQPLESERMHEISSDLRNIGDQLNDRHLEQNAEQDLNVDEIVRHYFEIIVQLFHLFWQR